jgi:hypothetical protein
MKTQNALCVGEIRGLAFLGIEQSSGMSFQVIDELLK